MWLCKEEKGGISHWGSIVTKCKMLQKLVHEDVECSYLPSPLSLFTSVGRKIAKVILEKG